MNIWPCLMAVLGILSTAKAQDWSVQDALAKCPKCALLCFFEAVPMSRCSLANSTCICSELARQQELATCIKSNCTIKESIHVRNVTSHLCQEPVRDISKRYVAISNAFGIASALFVIQRFMFKYFTKISIKLDDWFTLLTSIVGVPTTVINAHGVVPSGMGRDIWTLTDQNITDFSRFFYLLEIFYFVEVSLVKIALIFFYLEIFPTPPVRRLLWGTISFVSLFGLAFALSAIFQCDPISYYWWKWDVTHEGHCVNMNALAWTNAAISISLDIWMLAIPLWQLKKLNMNWKSKLSVGLMIGVGTFVTIISILRLQSLVKFGSNSVNPTWDFFDVGVWSTVEINVAIICVCLPSLRLLLSRVFPSLLNTAQHYHARYNHGTRVTSSVEGDHTSRGIRTEKTIEVNIEARNPRDPLDRSSICIVDIASLKNNT